MTEAPIGFCACWCGGKTTVPTSTSRFHNRMAGIPVRFLSGHNNRRPIAERFWAKVQKYEGDACWIWNGCHYRHGYGQTSIDGKHLLAHRVAWALEHGPIPEGLHVLHKCDNPPCVRHHHLFLGTRSDNMRDCVQKGRHPKPPEKHACPQGHPYSGYNLIINAKGRKLCRICGNVASLRWWRNKRKGRLHGH